MNLPNFRRLLLLGAALATAALACSCSNSMSGQGLAAYHAYDLPTQLPKDRSKVRVKVSLSKQRTYVMEGSEMLLAMPVSVGDAAHPTPTGNFTIHSKNARKRANSHGFAFSGDRVLKTYLAQRPSGWLFKGTPMPYWCEFKTNYGFHTGWIKHHPCTHGCIRMHENLSPKFFQLVSVGTPVSIAYSQPEDQTHGTIPLPPDSGPLPDYPGSMYVGDGYFQQHKTPVFD